jgi:hypothetical protein
MLNHRVKINKDYVSQLSHFTGLHFSFVSLVLYSFHYKTYKKENTSLHFTHKTYNHYQPATCSSHNVTTTKWKRDLVRTSQESHNVITTKWKRYSVRTSEESRNVTTTKWKRDSVRTSQESRNVTTTKWDEFFIKQEHIYKRIIKASQVLFWFWAVG